MVAAIEQSGSGIRRLDVAGNRIRNPCAVALGCLLASDSCALTALDVARNDIGSAGARALAGALRTNCTLTELRLGNRDIGSDGTAAVVAALKHNPHIRLQVLALSGGSIEQPAAAALAEALQRSGSMERLEVNGCSLTDEGMFALAAGIGHSHSLQHLDLSYNKLGAAGAAALAAVIGSCSALTWLCVSGNEIGDEGLAALAPALAHVRTLNLHHCRLTSHSGEPLASLILHSRALASLIVGKNVLGARGVEAIAAALQPSSRLRTLSLQYGCGVGVDGAAALADALRRGWRASELHLDSDHSIGDGGALVLAAALAECGSRCPLTALSLSFCGLTAAGARALVRAAKSAPALKSLVLSNQVEAADRPAVIAECGPQPHFELRLS